MIVVLPVVIVGFVIAGSAHAGGAARVWVAGAGIPASSQELVVRFLERSHRFRTSGAGVGVVLVLTGLLLLPFETGRGWPGEVDVVALASVALAGSILGSLAAEAFRLRRPPGPRTASLAVRDPAAYRDPVSERRERVVLILAGGAVVAALATQQGVARAVAGGGIVLALAGLRRWATRRIATRPRPAVPLRLTEADDLVRRLATSVGLGRPMVVLMALVASTQWAALVGPGTEDPARTAVAWVAVPTVIGLLAVAGTWWWQNRRFGFRPPPPVRTPGKG